LIPVEFHAGAASRCNLRIVRRVSLDDMKFPIRPTLALIASFTVAHAAPDPRIGAFIETRFKQLDVDRDGRLSPEESRPVAEIVRGADADGDGSLTSAEVIAHIGRQGENLAKTVAGGRLGQLAGAELAQKFKELDKDANGRLEGEELAPARWVARLDLNGDRAVTLEEIKALVANFVTPEAPASEVAPPPFVPPDSPREAPQRLKASEHGVGGMVPDATFTMLDGKEHRLSDFTSPNKALVVALVSPTCPVGKRYLPTLAALEKEYRGKGVALLLVAPTATDTPEALRAAFAAASLTAPCVADAKGALAKSLGALASTDAFILDARRTLTYRGAIDDQYGLGYSLDAPRQRYLAAALDATLAGRSAAFAATSAPGCALDLAPAPAAPRADLTYHRRISRLVQTHCAECHRAGGVAPFALETYEQVAAKAGMIRKMVERRLMPPWFAAPPAAGAHSPWLNDRSLPEADRADLLAWIAAGKPLGDERDAPLARTWPGPWQIGQPDAIVQIAAPIEIKATGTMPYQNVFVDTDFGGEKWVRAVEVKPTAREVVHHVLVFAREKGARDRGRRGGGEEDGAGGGFFAAYVPGNDHVIFPDGYAKSLPAGARLHFQIHYTPNGAATRDQMQLGLRFADGPPAHIVRVAGISSPRLSIPPGAAHHPETAAIPVPTAVKLLGFTPHMHVRGAAFRYEIIPPGGAPATLLEIPRYDFNWQLSYRYAEPPTIPAGSRLRATGWFDNSPANPANPDPTKTVRWGPQTSDEMMIGYVEYYVVGERPQVAAK
jgi:peroxiredoxin